MNTNFFQHPTSEQLAAFALGKAVSQADTIAEHVANCSRCEAFLSKTPRDTFLEIFKKANANLSNIQSNSLYDGLTELPQSLRHQSRYTFFRKLGGGGMGVVYLAEHKLMKRKVAVKLIPPELIGNAAIRNRFLQEVVSAAALEHPNVVRAYSAEDFGEHMLFEMEFVDGKDLNALVKSKGPLPVPNAVNYIRQAALGLQHAMTKSLVHRDIKPGNLMLTRTGTVKVADFGLAKFSRETDKERDSRLTGMNAMMGTPDFMAPEQARNTKDADIRADIYSLGCTFYFLLTGQPPFSGESIGDLIFKHWQDPRPDVSELRNDVSKELAQCIQKMMAIEPSDRPKSPKEVIEELTRVSKAEPKRKENPELPRAEGEPREANLLQVELDPPKLAPQHSKSSLLIPLKNTKLRRPGSFVFFGVGIVALLVGIVLLQFSDRFRMRARQGVLVLESLPEGSQIKVDGKIQSIDTKNAKQIEIEVSSGQKHRLEVLTSKGIIFGEEFEVDPGSRKSIQIQSLDGNSTKHQGGFVSIFNGKDFTGWEVESGAPSSWAIKEGELCAIGVADDTEATLRTQGYLFSTKDYKDFVLRFQFLQANGPYDWSGVALRAIPHETVQCVEPLWTENIPWHLTAIVGKRSPTQSNAFVPGALLWTVGPMPFLPPDRLIDLRKPGEWNDFELELKGQFLRMTLNGTEIQNVMLNKVSRPQKFVPGLNRFYGRIGFMKRVGEVHYRNIEIKELNEDSDAKP